MSLNLKPCIICYRVVSSSTFPEDVQNDKAEIRNEDDLKAPAARISEENLMRFFQLMGRHLDLGDLNDDPGKYDDDGVGVVLGHSQFQEVIKSASLFTTCGGCSIIVASFCDLYDQMKTTELLLNWKVWTLKNIMSCAQRVPSRVKMFRGSLEQFEGDVATADKIIHFKRELVKKCGRKLKGTFPRLKLEKLETREQISGQGPQMTEAGVTFNQRSNFESPPEGAKDAVDVIAMEVEVEQGTADPSSSRNTKTFDVEVVKDLEEPDHECRACEGHTPEVKEFGEDKRPGPVHVHHSTPEADNDDDVSVDVEIVDNPNLNTPSNGDPSLMEDLGDGSPGEIEIGEVKLAGGPSISHSLAGAENLPGMEDNDDQGTDKTSETTERQANMGTGTNVNNLDATTPNRNLETSGEGETTPHLFITGRTGLITKWRIAVPPEIINPVHPAGAHGTGVMIELESGKRTCYLCDTEFENESKYQQHLKVSYKCTLCGMGFTRRDYYNGHYLCRHLGIRFKCDACGKTFTQRGKLVMHQRKKNLCTGPANSKQKKSPGKVDKLYKCDLCSASYARPSGLSVHRKAIHLNIRFNCDTCSKSFRTKWHLNCHVRSAHGGGQTYKCGFCSRTFSSFSGRYRHIKRFCPGKLQQDSNGLGAIEGRTVSETYILPDEGPPPTHPVTEKSKSAAKN